MSKTYYPTIGLEIHAELNTKSKMFCGCKNDPDEDRPNVNICPVCMAHPGTLPVANKQAIENVVKVGLAVGAEIADFTEFDRKNYFYPDIPKGYQISQYKYPIVSHGQLNGIDITRIHIEEDTGTNKHDRGDFSLVDFNRAGVPLMELVTEPVIHSAKDASAFAREFQLLLRYLGVSEANMEKGEMRVEANISLSDDPKKFGTKVEVKNLNSFKVVEKAIEYELKRMEELYEEGKQGEIVQETRGWDENKQKTFSQRSKENANDYRYFPDPDLPKMKLHSLFDLKKIQSGLPELPAQKRARYMNEYGLKDIDVYIEDMNISAWFESLIKLLKDKEQIKTASNYIVSDYLGLKKVNPDINLPKIENFAELVEMIANGEVTSRGAKDILAKMVVEDISPKSFAKENGLLQENNEDSLKPIIADVLKANEKIAGDYKAGKEAAMQALVGMVMKATKGSANPSVAVKLIKELLK
jgi:aspartyl-tRNA(Asn)/glutamyl-tRNA(Gln) amidotransferase subunit B